MPHRVVILDSCLEINEGHHDHFARHARRDLAARRVELVIHGSARVDPDLARTLDIVPTFGRRSYDAVSGDPYDGPLVDFVKGAALFAADAARCLQASVRPGDLVVLPTAAISELAGLAQIAQRTAPNFRLAALFHRPGVGRFRDSQPGSLTGALLRNVARALTAFDPDSLWIGALTEPLCDSLRSALGRPVTRPAAPVWYADPPPRSAHPRPRIGFFGHLRIEKAALHMPALTAAVRAAVPEAICVIAGHHDRGVPDYGPLLALAAVGVELHLGWQEEAAFAELMAGCDLAVLPYDPAAYRDAQSGIFCHAAAHATPVVAPAGTWMADQIVAGRAAGRVYAGDSADDVAVAVEQALAEIEPLRRQARATVEAWRRTECGGRLLDELLRFGFGTPFHPTGSERPLS